MLALSEAANGDKLYMYGSFDSNGNPEKIQTAALKRKNNDTVLCIVFNDSLKVRYLYTKVNGVRMPGLYQFDYVKDSTVILSVYNYNWNTSSGQVKYQGVAKKKGTKDFSITSAATFRVVDSQNLVPIEYSRQSRSTSLQDWLDRFIVSYGAAHDALIACNAIIVAGMTAIGYLALSGVVVAGVTITAPVAAAIGAVVGIFLVLDNAAAAEVSTTLPPDIIKNPKLDLLNIIQNELKVIITNVVCTHTTSGTSHIYQYYGDVAIPKSAYVSGSNEPFGFELTYTVANGITYTNTEVNWTTFSNFSFSYSDNAYYYMINHHLGGIGGPQLLPGSQSRLRIHTNLGGWSNTIGIIQ